MGQLVVWAAKTIKGQVVGAVSGNSFSLTGGSGASRDPGFLERCFSSRIEQCAACMTYLLHYVTDHCYVFIAITGRGFCGSAWRVAALLAKHPLQCGVNGFLKQLLVALILIAVPAAIYLLTFMIQNVFGVYNLGLSRDGQCCGGKSCWGSFTGPRTAHQLGTAAQQAGAVGQAALNQAFSSLNQCAQGQFLGEEGFSIPLICTLIAFLLMFGMSSMYGTAVDSLYVCCYRDLEKFGGRYMENTPELEKLLSSTAVAASDSEDERRRSVASAEISPPRFRRGRNAEVRA